MDGEPSNPELLDWLAADFVDHGYDLKRLIATIMESRAYQSGPPPTAGSPPKSSPTPSAPSPATGTWSNGHYTREWRIAASL